MKALNIKAGLYAVLGSTMALGGSVASTGATGEETHWLAALLGSLVAGLLAFFSRLLPSPAETSDYATLGFKQSSPQFKKKQRKGFGWSSLLGAALQIGTQVIAGAPLKQAIIGGVMGGIIGGTGYATPRDDDYAKNKSPYDTNDHSTEGLEQE